MTTKERIKDIEKRLDWIERSIVSLLENVLILKGVKV